MSAIDAQFLEEPFECPVIVRFGFAVALDDGLPAVSSVPDDERDLTAAVTLFEV
jgi:hypothetical protein